MKRKKNVLGWWYLVCSWYIVYHSTSEFLFSFHFISFQLSLHDLKRFIFYFYWCVAVVDVVFIFSFWFCITFHFKSLLFSVSFYIHLIINSLILNYLFDVFTLIASSFHLTIEMFSYLFRCLLHFHFELKMLNIKITKCDEIKIIISFQRAIKENRLKPFNFFHFVSFSHFSVISFHQLMSFWFSTIVFFFLFLIQNEIVMLLYVCVCDSFIFFLSFHIFGFII